MQSTMVVAALGGASEKTQAGHGTGHAVGLDTGLAALCLLARLHHVAADPAQLRHQLGLAASEPTTVNHLLLAAQALGLKAKRSKSTLQRLSLAALPALVLMRDGSVALLAQCDGTRVLLQRFDGTESRPMIEPLAEFGAEWSGELILVTSRASLAGELAKFDFS